MRGFLVFGLGEGGVGRWSGSRSASQLAGCPVAGADWVGWGRPGCSRFVRPSLHLSRPHHIPDGSLRLAPNSHRDTRDWKETLCAGLQGQYRRPEKPPLEGPIASCPLPYTLVRTLQCPDGCIPDSGLYFIHVLSGVCGSEFVFLNASPIPTRSLSCPYG